MLNAAAAGPPSSAIELSTFFLSSSGVPRYVGMWLVLTPVVMAVLLLARLRWTAVVVFTAVTFPSLLKGSLPGLTADSRYVLVTAGLVAIGVWLVRHVRAVPAAERPTPAPPPWRALAGLAVLTLAVRVPLAWIDPGISSIGLSTEHAVRELLSGVNPYAEPNPFANFGTYQYPAGTILANLPLVAVVPEQVFGEQHLGIRATSWLVDVLNVAVIVLMSARWGRVRAGLLGGAMYALCAPLVRDSGLSTANDLLLALFVLLAVAALAERRSRLAGVAVGLAIAVKPPAVLLLPLLLPAAGLVPALIAAAVPALLQAPLLLWQAPGWKELEAFAEPAGRSDGELFLAHSLWYPVFPFLGSSPGVLKVLALLGIVVAAGAAWWAGRRLRAPQLSLPHVAAAVCLPLFVVFALAPVPRLNYQDWYIPPLLLALAHAGTRSRPEARRPAEAGAGGAVQVAAPRTATAG